MWTLLLLNWTEIRDVVNEKMFQAEYEKSKSCHMMTLQNGPTFWLPSCQCITWFSNDDTAGWIPRPQSTRAAFLSPKKKKRLRQIRNFKLFVFVRPFVFLCNPSKTVDLHKVSPYLSLEDRWHIVPTTPGTLRAGVAVIENWWMTFKLPSSYSSRHWLPRRLRESVFQNPAACEVRCLQKPTQQCCWKLLQLASTCLICFKPLVNRCELGQRHYLCMITPTEQLCKNHLRHNWTCLRGPPCTQTWHVHTHIDNVRPKAFEPL